MELISVACSRLILNLSSCFSSSGSFSLNSRLHHSSTYPGLIRTEFRFATSLNGNNMSPRYIISSMSGYNFLASALFFIFLTLPFTSFTIGPSIVSQLVTTPPFVGFSIFSWVPIAIKSSVIAIVAGCRENALKPETLPLPYLNLNPPDLDGCPNTGLPATRSCMYVGDSSVFPISLFSCSFMYSPRKSNPLDLNPLNFRLFSSLNAFCAFCARPSPRIRHIPPLR